MEAACLVFLDSDVSSVALHLLIVIELFYLGLHLLYQ